MTTSTTTKLTQLETQLLKHVAREALLDAYEESYNNGFFENFCHGEPEDFDWGALWSHFQRVGDGDTELKGWLRYDPDPSLDLSFAVFEAELDDLRSAFEECYDALGEEVLHKAHDAFEPYFDWEVTGNTFVVSVGFKDL